MACRRAPARSASDAMDRLTSNDNRDAPGVIVHAEVDSAALEDNPVDRMTQPQQEVLHNVFHVPFGLSSHGFDAAAGKYSGVTSRLYVIVGRRSG